MAQPDAIDCSSWSSTGLRRREAIREWQDWAARVIAPIDVCVFDRERFTARWRSHSIGPLSMLELTAPAQRVVHRGDGGSGAVAPSIQLVYARRGTLRTRIGPEEFAVSPGEFVLLDNSRFYQMEMDGSHQAIDLIMPRRWLERWLPAPDRLLSRPVSARVGWGRPLGSLVEVMARGVGESPLPRQMLADQIGALLMLATETGEAAPGRQRDQLTRTILRRIETGFADPDLAADQICRELGISSRYLQALLAGRGTSFVRELTATRLARAGAILADRRTGVVQIGEVALRCGFLDPNYFARQFRRRFGVTPREWRRLRTAGS